MRPILFAIAGGALALTALAGCVTTGMAPQSRGQSLASGQCLSQPLDDTRVLDDHTLLARDLSGRAALFHMASPCMQVNEAIIMRYFGGGPICGPLDVDISGTNGSGMIIPMHCMVQSVTPLSKAEAQQMFYGSGRKS